MDEVQIETVKDFLNRFGCKGRSKRIYLAKMCIHSIVISLLFLYIYTMQQICVITSQMTLLVEA